MNKGLLYKDFFEIKNYAYLIIFLFLIILEPRIIAPIVMLYACFLTYTLFEVDSNNKFDIMLNTMPINAKDFVISRYLIGFVLCIVIGCWTAVIPFVYSLVSGQNVDVNATVGIAQNAFLIACIFQSIMLPIVIRFGVIKSKLYLIGLTAVAAIIAIVYIRYFNISVQAIQSIISHRLTIIILIIFLISIFISYLAKKI